MSDNTNTQVSPAVAGLVGVVRATGGNLSAAARRLSIPRDTVVSRLRKHGLLPLARGIREQHRRQEEQSLRATLELLPPSERVRLLLPPAHAREALLVELASREDLDEDARALLRDARLGCTATRAA